MDLEKALKRIWRTWRFGFLAAIFIYILVFYLAYTYEVHREEESELGEDPVPLFKVDLEPRISAGARNYIINLTNDQDYIIQEVNIEFSGVTMAELQDQSNTYREIISSGSELSFHNPVYSGVTSIDLTLDDEMTVPGFNNIDLFLTHVNSSTVWSSESSGNHEEINLNEGEITGVGFGDYSATIRHVSGFRDVPFRLTFRITYGQLVSQRSTTEPINTGESKDFQFYLNLNDAQIDELVCDIESNVELPNGLLIDLKMRYNAKWILVMEDRPIPEDVSEDIPWGPVDLTGTSSAIMYTITVFAGFAFYIRSKIKNIFMPKVIRRAHCFIALTSLMLVLAHMSTAMQKDWPWESIGMRFAVIATGLLTFFVIFSFFDVEIIKAIGKKNWRLSHLIITILLALSIIIHFGLMGDHLGFLKDFNWFQ